MVMEILHRGYMKLSNNSFNDHFNFFKNKILNNENFVFARYADGERLILQNKAILEGTQAFDVDKWKYNNNKLFSRDLLETCNHRETNYYYAISCACCDPTGEIFYKNLFNNHNITFSNLFINANYTKFINFTENLQRDVILIANKECENSHYPFNILEKFLIEDDCINWYEKNKNNILETLKIISKKYENKLFFISAGPLSEIIIHNLFLNNQKNAYIDIGSSLDIFTHKKMTRPYQIKNSIYHNLECKFNEF